MGTESIDLTAYGKIVGVSAACIRSLSYHLDEYTCPHHGTNAPTMHIPCHTPPPCTPSPLMTFLPCMPSTHTPCRACALP